MESIGEQVLLTPEHLTICFPRPCFFFCPQGMLNANGNEARWSLPVGHAFLVLVTCGSNSGSEQKTRLLWKHTRRHHYGTGQNTERNMGKTRRTPRSSSTSDTEPSTFSEYKSSAFSVLWVSFFFRSHLYSNSPQAVWELFDIIVTNLSSVLKVFLLTKGALCFSPPLTFRIERVFLRRELRASGRVRSLPQRNFLLPQYGLLDAHT